MGKPVWKVEYYLFEVQLNVQRQFKFEIFGYHTIGNRWQQSTFTDGGCRRIISYTSYLRTNDCTNNGYVTDMLEHNTMINIDTGAHMILHNTQSWAHWAHFIDAYWSCVTSWLKSSSPRHSIHAWSSVRCVVVVLFTRLLFLSFPLLFFQTFQTSSSEFHKKFMSKDLRDFRLGTVASNDHETPLTGDEQLRRDQQLLHEQLSEQNRELREAHEKSLNEIEGLKRFQGVYIRYIFKEKTDRRSRTPSLNSQVRFRNYRMKFIVWVIREILKMLNQYAVDNPTLPVNQCFSYLSEILAEC